MNGSLLIRARNAGTLEVRLWESSVNGCGVEQTECRSPVKHLAFTLPLVSHSSLYLTQACISLKPASHSSLHLTQACIPLIAKIYEDNIQFKIYS
jgi:hypothetical protein